jgi:hypothetical protein
MRTMLPDDRAMVRCTVVLVAVGLAVSACHQQTRLRIAFNYDPGYYTTLLGHAAVLSTAEVKALLARELDPGMEVVVLLGERTAVMTAFSDAGLVDVELVEAKGK